MIRISAKGFTKILPDIKHSWSAPYAGLFCFFFDDTKDTALASYATYDIPCLAVACRVSAQSCLSYLFVDPRYAACIHALAVVLAPPFFIVAYSNDARC